MYDGRSHWVVAESVMLLDRLKHSKWFFLNDNKAHLSPTTTLYSDSFLMVLSSRRYWNRSEHTKADSIQPSALSFSNRGCTLCLRDKKIEETSILHHHLCCTDGRSPVNHFAIVGPFIRIRTSISIDRGYEVGRVFFLITFSFVSSGGCSWHACFRLLRGSAIQLQHSIQ